jgi:hypothetical protein
MPQFLILLPSLQPLIYGAQLISSLQSSRPNPYSGVAEAPPPDPPNPSQPTRISSGPPQTTALPQMLTRISGGPQNTTLPSEPSTARDPPQGPPKPWAGSLLFTQKSQNTEATARSNTNDGGAEAPAQKSGEGRANGHSLRLSRGHFTSSTGSLQDSQVNYPGSTRGGGGAHLRPMTSNDVEHNSMYLEVLQGTVLLAGLAQNSC